MDKDRKKSKSLEVLSEKEYPRPDYAREQWTLLDGTWDFSWDKKPVGQEEYPKKIRVPFAFQTKASGIGDTNRHDLLYYRKQFAADRMYLEKRTFLHFGAVDYEAEVFINGHFLGSHKGGYTPFSFEVTGLLRESDNELLVTVRDYPDKAQPRGKQYWKETPDRCWYTPTSGIWQSVWLEGVPGRRLEALRITPDIDRAGIRLETELEPGAWEEEGWRLELDIFYKGSIVQQADFSMGGSRQNFFVGIQEEDAIDEMHYWSPEHPNLYEITARLYQNDVCHDCVGSYFGMRKIACEKGRIMLNNYPYYLRMVLDQGYWQDSGLTPPSDEALRRDVELCLAYGFNGARKHQKPESPRYYYWCDRLGLLTWGELPSAYEFGWREMENLTRDMQEFIKRDYNHPSIIAWVPLNESWGVRKMKNDSCQQHFGESLYHLCKAWDPLRLVSTNDGWENVTGDIVGIHDYARDGSSFRERYTGEQMGRLDTFYPGHRKLMADGYSAGEMATMITEYGGIALRKDAVEGAWGYAEAEQDLASLVERYREVTMAIQDIPETSGYCYTQLTDVYQEVNGLLNADHSVKVPPEEIAEINCRRTR